MKEKWKTLFQAMIIPLIVVLLFVTFVSLPTIQGIEEVGAELKNQTLGNPWLRSSVWDNLYPVLIFLIGLPVIWFVIGTLFLYFVIDYMKKRKN